MKDAKALSPILSMVKPLAKKHATPENMSALFDALTSQFPTAPGEKNLLIVNRAPDGTVMGGVWAVDTATRTLTGAYVQMPLDQLIVELLGKI